VILIIYLLNRIIMKKSLLFVLFVLLSVVTSFGQDLVLTAVYDGPLTGGVPKGIELYAINDISDLSQYGLANATNGNPSDAAPEFTFDSQAVTAGTFLYVSSEVDGFTAFFGFAPNATSSVCNINGDDCIELYYNGAIVDVFGEVGVDGTGTAWDYLDGWAYRVSNTTANGSTFDINNWSFSGTNALDSETENATSTTPIPVGTYTTGGTVEEYAKVPTFTPEGGIYTTTQSVEIATETEGASIYYTIDGSDPDESSTLYSAPISVSTTTTIKAKAYKTDMTASSIATATYTFPEEVADIAALRAKVGEGGTYKLTGEAIISFMQDSRNQKFVQDATGGITIDDASGVITSTYAQFDGVTGLIGTLSSYNELIQFIPAMDPGVASSTGNTLTPTVVTIPTLEANWDMYESTLITIEGVAFEDADGSATFGNGSNYNVTDENSNGLVVRTGFRDVSLIGEVIPMNANVTGVAQRYNTTFQLFPRSADDVEDTATGLDKTKENTVRIIPNPFTTEFRIDGDAVSVTLYNAAGQLVKNVPAVAVSTSDLSKGMYILQVKLADGTVSTQKVIKK